MGITSNLLSSNNFISAAQPQPIGTSTTPSFTPSSIPGGAPNELAPLRGTASGESRIDPRLAPYLEMGLQRAERLFFGQDQPQMYPGQMYVSPSQQTLQALASQEQLASSAAPIIGAAQQTYLQNLNATSGAAPLYQNIYGASGYQPGASVYEQAAGGQFAPQTAGLQNLASQAQAGVPSIYNQVAGGGFQNLALPGTANTAYGGFLQGSPYQQQMIQAATRPLVQKFTESVIPGISSQFSQAGRYGSGAMERAQSSATESFGRALGDVTANIVGQDYARERAFQEAAMGQLGQLSQQDLANRLAAAGTGEATRQAQLAQAAGLQGQILGAQQQGVANQLAGAAGLQQAQQSALASQLAAAGGLGTVQGQDISRQLTAAQAAPSFFQSSFLPSQALAQVGAAQEQIASQPLQEAMQRYQYSQQLPYNQLSSFLSSVYGTPMGGSNIPTPQAQTNQWGQALGGATLGYTLSGGNPYAAGAGGLLGYLF